MDKTQLFHQTTRWPIEQIQAEIGRCIHADDETIDRLKLQRVYLLLPDTEHSKEVRYLIGQFRDTGQLDVIADRFEKIPVSGVGQVWEGYCLYSTSLFIALGLLKFTTCYYGWLRCALFVERSQSKEKVSPLVASPASL